MPVTPTYPGVYVEEIPSSVHTITGVSTSVTAFIGYTPMGPVNQAVQILNYGDYERNFGGLSKDSELGYAVQQFFLNGGTSAWVVRSASGAAKATVTLETPGGTLKVLVLTASSEGTWANYLKIDVNYNTTNPDSSFNLTVTEYIPQGQDLVQGRQEVFSNLSMDSQSAQYAPNVINGASQLITAARHSAVEAAIPTISAGWSLSTDVSGVAFPLANTSRFISIIVDGDGPYEIPIFPDGSPSPDINTLVTELQSAIQAINPGKTRFSSFSVTRADADRTPNAATGKYLLFISGTPGDATREQSAVHLLNASSNNASKVLGLGLANHGREGGGEADLRPAATGTFGVEVFDVSTIAATDKLIMQVTDGTTDLGTSAAFALGTTVASLNDLATALTKAIRAAMPDKPAFTSAAVTIVGNHLQVVSGTERTDALISFSDDAGNLATKTGLVSTSAEDNVQRYSLGVGATRADQTGAFTGDNGTPPDAGQIIGDQASKTGIYALEDVDIFNLLCIPLVADMYDTSAQAVISAAQAYCAERRAFYIVDPPRKYNTVDSIKAWDAKLNPDAYSAIYFPFIEIPDPLDGLRLNAFPPSGTIAGLYSRIDSNRGVWKAPAGTEATLTNVQALTYNLTDGEVGVLNQLGVNCLRQLPVYGRVSWGARTLAGNDQLASDWKYVPVRRVALYIESSLYQGTQWVVFEPNDEPLWAQIRLNVGSFMQTLFQQGAFQGSSARDAYFVKCDKETTTQDDINRGVVNILVGFAPLKPAEFVIIQIQQMAGQTQS